MFEQIFETMRKATETNVRMQQELFQRWTALWPGSQAPPPALPAGQAEGFRKKWAEAVNELIKRQRQTQEEQFAAGLKQIEQAFKFAEVKDIETLRARTLELWRQTFQLLQQSYVAQVRDFHDALGTWAEMLTKAA
jgi:hypothetical protein